MKVVEYSRQDIVLALMVNAYDLIKISPNANFGLFNKVDNELVDIIAKKIQEKNAGHGIQNRYYPSLKSFDNETSTFLYTTFPDGRVSPANRLPEGKLISVFFYGLKNGLTLDSPTSESYFPDYVINVFRRKVDKGLLEFIKTEIMYPSKDKFFEIMKQKYQRYAGTMDMDVMKDYYSDYEINFLTFCNSRPGFYQDKRNQYTMKDD